MKVKYGKTCSRTEKVDLTAETQAIDTTAYSNGTLVVFDQGTVCGSPLKKSKSNIWRDTLILTPTGVSPTTGQTVGTAVIPFTVVNEDGAIRGEAIAQFTIVGNNIDLQGNAMFNEGTGSYQGGLLILMVMSWQLSSYLRFSDPSCAPHPPRPLTITTIASISSSSSSYRYYSSITDITTPAGLDFTMTDDLEGTRGHITVTGVAYLPCGACKPCCPDEASW